MKHINFSLITLIALANVALSDELDSSLNDVQKRVNLGPSVVTASGYEQSIKTAPASISIIEKEEILTRPIRDIGDAVQDVPGVYVEQDKTGMNTISMRGLNSNYTLILIDGKRQNVTRGFIQNGIGNQNSFMPPVSMIERIEVIRGPASTIYGSEAMGGVINIITKKHTNELKSGIQLETKLFEPNSEWGNVYGANMYVNTPLVKDLLSLNLRATARYNEQNGFLNPEWVSSYSKNKYATHSSTGSHNFSGGFRLNYTPTKNDYIYLDSELYNARLGSLNTSSNSITAVREVFKLNSTLSHDGSYEWGKLSTYVQHGYNLMYPHYNVPVGGTKGQGMNKTRGTQAQSAIFQTQYTNDIELGSVGLIFNGGLNYFFEDLKKLDLYKNGNYLNQHQAAAFAEGEFLLSDIFSTTLGLRLNYSDRFKTIPNPRIYFNYMPTDFLTIKAGVASGMLVPTLSQTIDGQIVTENGRGGGNGTVTTYGNPNLKPEQSINYELSGIIDTDSTMLIITGFYTDFNNQIETLANIQQGQPIPGTGYTCNGNSGTCTTYRNISQSLVTGGEASFKLKPIGGFSLDSSYGYTYTKSLSEPSKGEPINSIPMHNFTITPKYRYKNFDIYVRYSGKYKTPTPFAGTNARSGVRQAVGSYYKDYQLVDIAASYKIGKHYAITLAVNNLFDVYFMDYARVTGRGDTITAQNRFQRVLPSRNYWISFRADF